jgi:hypothetical protein
VKNTVNYQTGNKKPHNHLSCKHWRKKDQTAEDDHYDGNNNPQGFGHF